MEVGTPVVTAAPFTMCAWIKADQLATTKGNEMQIVDIGDNSGVVATEANWFTMRIDDEPGNENHPQATLRQYSSIAGVSSTAAISANTWHFICYVEEAVDSRAIYLDAGWK